MQDYKPTPYLVEHVYLDFLLNEDKSTVKSKLSMMPNYGDSSSTPKLELDGLTLPGLAQNHTFPMRLLPFAVLREKFGCHPACISAPPVNHKPSVMSRPLAEQVQEA